MYFDGAAVIKIEGGKIIVIILVPLENKLGMGKGSFSFFPI